MNFTYKCPNCDTEIEGDFTPARPAPVCSNHDSPAFSDPGEGAEWDGPEDCPECDEPINMDIVMEKAQEQFEAQAIEMDYHDDSSED